jgi:hypothetical protein
MAVHMGATCGLGMRHLTLAIACTRRLISRSYITWSQTGEVTLSTLLSIADLMGLKPHAL